MVCSSLFPSPAHAETEAWLVTMLPGDRVFTRYGHIAIRLADSDGPRDMVYSYGHAPFDRPGFVFQYLRGEAFFFGKAQPWRRVVERYSAEDRTIQLQRLRLTPAQLDDLVSRLERSIDPEVRDYRYDQHRDNCATRIRDLLDAVSGGSLRRAAAQAATGRSYRDFTLEAGAGRLGVHIGLDFIAGPSLDRPIDGWEAMFLPVNVRDTVGLAGEDGRGPLADPVTEAYRRRGPPAQHGSRLAGRMAVMAAGALLGLALLGAGLRGGDRHGPGRARLEGLLLLASGLPFGLLGTLAWALVAVSRAPDFAWNENVLLFWPLDLVWALLGLVWLVRGRRTALGVLRGYVLVRLLVLLPYSLAKCLGLFPQDNWAFLAASTAVVVGLSVSLWHQAPSGLDSSRRMG